MLETEDIADNAVARLRAALDRKDVGEVHTLARNIHGLDSEVLASLISAAGPAENALGALTALKLPPTACDAI